MVDRMFQPPAPWWPPGWRRPMLGGALPATYAVVVVGLFTWLAFTLISRGWTVASLICVAIRGRARHGRQRSPTHGDVTSACSSRRTTSSSTLGCSSPSCDGTTYLRSGLSAEEREYTDCALDLFALPELDRPRFTGDRGATGSTGNGRCVDAAVHRKCEAAAMPNDRLHGDPLVAYHIIWYYLEYRSDRRTIATET